MARDHRLVFGEDAEAYDRARRSYPAALIDDLLALAGPEARVVDAGCATGRHHYVTKPWAARRV